MAKSTQVYILGIVVVLLCVGAAVAHVLVH